MLAVAHRAANSLEELARAPVGPGCVVEADVHWHRGRLEVRHLKTAGPLPFLWDRWEIVPASAPRLQLADLLAADRHGAGLMLDLKGRSMTSAPAVARALITAGAGPEVMVCGRYWPSVDEVARLAGVRAVLSARNRFERRALTRRVLGRGPAPFGVSVHASRLDATFVAQMRQHVTVLMTWPIDDLETLDRVSALGVNAVITNDDEILREVRIHRSTPDGAGLWSTTHRVVPPAPDPGDAG